MVHSHTTNAFSSKDDGGWVVQLLFNIVGYSTIFLPGYFVIRYLKSIKYGEQGDGGWFKWAIVSCVFGNDVDAVDMPSSEKKSNNPLQKSTMARAIKMVLCAAGLQISFLTWGVIQERIMTVEYGKTESFPGEKFKNSQFIIFTGSLFSTLIAGIYISLTNQPLHGCPQYKFSYASISNIMSSWCQYEALKYVSFPTQVLGKACKVIPVMLMGKIISGNKYQFYEWVTAGMLSLGISLFLLAQSEDSTSLTYFIDGSSSTYSYFSGIILMIGYMSFDSFTANWEGELFKMHKISSIQMMFGVNLFSSIFTFVSLLQQGGFLEALSFIFRHSDFAVHCILHLVFSEFGVLLIFYTISEFGAVIFTIIMTSRQAFAILLSCIIYSHPVSATGSVGIVIVFAALFLRIYVRSNKYPKVVSQGKHDITEKV